MYLKNINVSGKKPYPKDYRLFNSVYMKLEKKTYYNTKEEITRARLGIGD